MLRYDRQTKPGLVALYDIRPGNGAGPFLQPGARMGLQMTKYTVHILGRTHRTQYSALVINKFLITGRMYRCHNVSSEGLTSVPAM